MANPTEVWPADATVEALDGTTDAATGLPYVAAAASPTSSPTLQVQVDRMLQRLFAALALLSELRPVKVSNTDIGIFAGRYKLGPTSYSYAGEASVAISTAADTYYVYLTSSGAVTVVTDATGWPADVTTYVPICEVTVAGSVITAIVDVRGRSLYHASTKPETTTIKTHANSPVTLTNADQGNLFINTGATSLVTINLPTAAVDLEFVFYIDDADGIKIVASTGDTVRILASVSAAAGYCQSTTIGSYVRLRAINATQWVAVASGGTWSVA